MNTGVRRASEVLGLADPIAFFCECRIAACYAVVWLSASAFDAWVAGQTGWLLADGHVPSVPWTQVAATSGRGLVVVAGTGASDGRRNDDAGSARAGDDRASPLP